VKSRRSATGELAECARKLEVLGDPTRFAVVELLLSGPRYVNELQAELGIEQSLLSHHLRVLRDAGLVDSVVDGKKRLYSKSGACTRRGIDLGCCRIAFPSHGTQATGAGPHVRREKSSP
jgi:DNA-binding transcriptional ArsR family regulator